MLATQATNVPLFFPRVTHPVILYQHRKGCMKYALLTTGLLTASLASSNLQATLMEVQFTGLVTSVNNLAGQLWSADAFAGREIKGRYLLDTAAAGEGHEETSFYWWWDIDNKAGALTTDFQIAGQSFQLTGDYDYDAAVEGWRTNEFLAIEHGIGDDGTPVADHLYLKDNETREELQGDISNFYRKTFEISVSDSLNNFLSGLTLDQTFQWTDTDPLDNQTNGDGQFKYYQSRTRFNGDEELPVNETLFDSTIKFRLTDVNSKPAGTPADISEPSSFALLLLGMSGFLFRRRKQK